jgi:hypothetical protein
MLLYLLATCVFFWAVRPSGWKGVFLAAGFGPVLRHPSQFVECSTVWNHNSFNFPFGVLLLLFLYRTVTRVSTHKEIPAGVLIGLGAAAGIMTAVTIYMAGWVIGIVTTIFVYHLLQKVPWQQTLFAAALTGISAIGGFFLAVLPILDKMSHFRNWIVSLLTHQSNYLEVPKDQPRLERLYSNFIEFYQILPTLFIFFVLLMAVSGIMLVLLRRKLTQDAGLWSIAIGLAAQSMAILLIFLDRPLHDNYFLSIAAILPVWALAVFGLLKPYQKIADVAGIALIVFAFAAMTFTAVNSVNAKRDEVNMLRHRK